MTRLVTSSPLLPACTDSQASCRRARAGSAAAARAARVVERRRALRRDIAPEHTGPVSADEAGSRIDRAGPPDARRAGLIGHPRRQGIADVWIGPGLGEDDAADGPVGQHERPA